MRWELNAWTCPIPFLHPVIFLKCKPGSLSFLLKASSGFSSHSKWKLQKFAKSCKAFVTCPFPWPCQPCHLLLIFPSHFGLFAILWTTERSLLLQHVCPWHSLYLGCSSTERGRSGQSSAQRSCTRAVCSTALLLMTATPSLCPFSGSYFSLSFVDIFSVALLFYWLLSFYLLIFSPLPSWI